MTLLVPGVILFFGMRSVSAVSDHWRNRMAACWGEPIKGSPNQSKLTPLIPSVVFQQHRPLADVSIPTDKTNPAR